MVLRCITLTLSAQAWLLAIFISISTPDSLLQPLIQDLETSLAGKDVRISVQAGVETIGEAPDWVLDASLDRYVGEVVREAAEEWRVPLVTLRTNQESDFSLHLPAIELGKGIQEVAKRFKWTTVTLIVEPSDYGNSLKAYLLSENLPLNTYLLPSDSPYEVVAGLMVKEIKVWASPIVVCAAAVETCAFLLQAAKQHHMLKAGYAYVLTHPPGRLQAQGMTGLLHVLEKGSEAAVSASQFHALRVAFLVDLVKADIAAGKTKTDWSTYQVWNWLGDQLKLLDKEVVFPGNTTAIPIVRKPTIPLSIDGDLTNPTAAPNTPYENYFLAARLAFSEMPTVLPAHDLLWHNVTYGCTQYVESYVRERLTAGKELLGVAHIAPIGSAVTMGATTVLKELGVALPMIGANIAVALGNSTMYPYYVRTIVSSSYGATVYMTLFKYFGWKKVNILYGLETYGIDFYENFLRIAKEYHIEISNRESLRGIDPFLTNETIGQYTEHFQEILRNNVRPLLCSLFLPGPAYVLQALYDLGARAGDIIYFGEISTQMLAVLPPGNASKAAELALGGMHVTSATYIGAVGKAAWSAFKRKYSFEPQTDSCFFYDSAYALAHTLKFLIYQGRNYEDPKVFMAALRKTQFRGCSGIVAFEPGSNDRSFSGYVIENLQGNSEQPRMVQAGYYTPTAIQLLTFDTPVIWPGGLTATPSNVLISLLNCPFKDRNLHKFPAGQVLASITCGVIVVLFAILSTAIYTKYWKNDPPPLTKKVLISLDDGLLMVSIVLEAFQYAALGPDYHAINRLLYAAGQLLSASLNEVVTFSNGVYWVCLDVALGTCGLWVCFLLYVYFRLDEKLANVVCLGNLGWLTWLMLPYIGNLCFLPIISVLLDVLVCDRAVGADSNTLAYSDSILYRDCYVQCWQGSHIAYVAGASAGLLLYAPLAVLLRPVWPEFQTQLHIKAAPSHYLVKTVFQVLIIGLSKSLKRENALAHGVVFLVLLLAFYLFELKRNRFNYGRVAHWHRISLLGVFWLSAVALLSCWVQLSSSYWLLTTALGWLGLVGFGLLWMWKRYPSLLVREKGVDTQQLFKFAFQFAGNREMRGFISRLNNRRRSSVSAESINVIVSN